MSFIAQYKYKNLSKAQESSDKQVNKLEKIFSKHVAKDVFARCRVENISNANKHFGTDVPKQMLLSFLVVLFSQLPSPSNFCTSS